MKGSQPAKRINKKNLKLWLDGRVCVVGCVTMAHGWNQTSGADDGQRRRWGGHTCSDPWTGIEQNTILWKQKFAVSAIVCSKWQHRRVERNDDSCLASLWEVLQSSESFFTLERVLTVPRLNPPSTPTCCRNRVVSERLGTWGEGERHRWKQERKAVKFECVHIWNVKSGHTTMPPWSPAEGRWVEHEVADTLMF